MYGDGIISEVLLGMMGLMDCRAGELGNCGCPLLMVQIVDLIE
jgi:hypothetical protein